MDQQRVIRGIPADVLKWIAIVSMLIDHIGVVFQAYMSERVYLTMRAIGRPAFPIFAFFIVEGYFHTRNVKKYLLRLTVFAFLSEIPFDQAMYLSGTGELFFRRHQNVFFTLAIGLLMIWILEKIRIGIPSMAFWPHLGQLLLTVCTVYGAILLANLVAGDYKDMGILLIVVFYLFGGYRGSTIPDDVPTFRKNIREPDYRMRQCLGLVLWTLYYVAFGTSTLEIYAIAAVPFLLLYNGKKGTLPVSKWVYYAFYPVHLFVLPIIRFFL